MMQFLASFVIGVGCALALVGFVCYLTGWLFGPKGERE